ncbi:hypothetical protein BKA56DRAFT_609744 [Ilyonectria sp. MPI-CAGE-AT-0026]|nr:hypothetical protein BKA56DRAFT_609744 [Ilyonectria sp. MPI-CAGE-AT-0026]
MSTLITTEPASGWPSTSLRQFFLYDTNHPASIEASVVAADSDAQTFVVTCPSSCDSSEFPKQTITHISGSSWAGERTWKGTTTNWGCNLGSGSDDEIPDQYGRCSATTIDGSDISGDFGDRAVNSCFVFARSVPAYITGGMDEMYEIYPYYWSTIDAGGLISANSEQMASMNCPATTADGQTPASKTDTSRAESTAEGSESQSRPAAETASQTEATTSAVSSETASASSTPTETEATSGSFRTPINMFLLVGSILLGAWACL